MNISKLQLARSYDGRGEKIDKRNEKPRTSEISTAKGIPNTEDNLNLDLLKATMNFQETEAKGKDTKKLQGEVPQYTVSSMKQGMSQWIAAECKDNRIFSEVAKAGKHRSTNGKVPDAEFLIRMCISESFRCTARVKETVEPEQMFPEYTNKIAGMPELNENNNSVMDSISNNYHSYTERSEGYGEPKRMKNQKFNTHDSAGYSQNEGYGTKGTYADITFD